MLKVLRSIDSAKPEKTHYVNNPHLSFGLQDTDCLFFCTKDPN